MADDARVGRFTYDVVAKPVLCGRAYLATASTADSRVAAVPKRVKALDDDAIEAPGEFQWAAV